MGEGEVSKGSHGMVTGENETWGGERAVVDTDVVHTSYGMS